jgi:hypothetical protein
MITTAKASKWPLDVPIKHPLKAGLPENSFVRMKLFTLDNRLILKSLGHLSEPDRRKVEDAIDLLFAFWAMAARFISIGSKLFAIVAVIEEKVMFEDADDFPIAPGRPQDYRLGLIIPRPRSEKTAPFWVPGYGEYHARQPSLQALAPQEWGFDMDNLLTIVFEAHNAEKNHHRRYQVTVGRDLLKDWTVAICYGRTGQGGRELRYAASEAEEMRAVIRDRLRGPVRNIVST